MRTSWRTRYATSRGDLLAFLALLHPRVTPHGLVRVGPAADGGYLVPDDLSDLRALFSPGVGNVSAFEREFADRGVDVFLADASVDGPAEEHPRFHFSKRFVGPQTTGETVSLADWVESVVPDDGTDLVLQMDIEGAEYDALEACPPELLARFRIVVVEFHGLQNLVIPARFRQMTPAFFALLNAHDCVHIHPNNCCGTATAAGITVPRVAEFTFLRRDRMQTSPPEYATEFPHPFDADNVPNRPSVVLPASMHQSARRASGSTRRGRRVG